MVFSQLTQLYTDYIQALGQAHKKASLFSGLFGQGSFDDPRSAPCNKEFYEATGAWVEAFAATNPQQEQLMEVAGYMLEAAHTHNNKPCHWYMLVAQGHVKQLIPLLSRENRAELAARYSKLYPKRQQLPLQREILSLLQA